MSKLKETEIPIQGKDKKIEMLRVPVLRHIGQFVIIEAVNTKRKYKPEKPLYVLTHILTGLAIPIRFGTLREAEFVGKQIKKHIHADKLKMNNADDVLKAFSKPFMKWICATRHVEFKNLKPFNPDPFAGCFEL